MREEKYVDTTDEAWEKFCEDHATAEYGDPMMTLKSLDKYLRKQGKEVVIVDNDSSDFFFRIEDNGVTLTDEEASLVRSVLNSYLKSADGRCQAAYCPDGYKILQGAVAKIPEPKE